MLLHACHRFLAECRADTGTAPALMLAAIATIVGWLYDLDAVLGLTRGWMPLFAFAALFVLTYFVGRLIATLADGGRGRKSDEVRISTRALRQLDERHRR
ncbi:hypothetical protein A6302_03037 [Methylobrevis pamukkalensis]|uniref:Uncharacterized protein n=2 Tax=Methylobrevis pamukkalensis TaxID=1439726 RepID=A0A1E3H021_9HYPH|nr:hypothetical protein A6302_03037 [Methylobrevis pamukkalensis]